MTAVLVCTKFYQVNKLAGYLLYPYVAFLLFANALNISIATKNQNVRDGCAGSCILAYLPGSESCEEKLTGHTCRSAKPLRSAERWSLKIQCRKAMCSDPLHAGHLACL